MGTQETRRCRSHFLPGTLLPSNRLPPPSLAPPTFLVRVSERCQAQTEARASSTGRGGCTSGSLGARRATGGGGYRTPDVGVAADGGGDSQARAGPWLVSSGRGPGGHLARPGAAAVLGRALMRVILRPWSRPSAWSLSNSDVNTAHRGNLVLFYPALLTLS